MNYVVLNVFTDWWKDTLRAERKSYGHTVQSVAERWIVHKFLKRSPAWIKTEKGINGFIVSFPSSFNQLKI